MAVSHYLVVRVKFSFTLFTKWFLGTKAGPYTGLLWRISSDNMKIFHFVYSGQQRNIFIHRTLSSIFSFFFFRVTSVMDSRVAPWFKEKRISRVKTDYAFQHSTHTVQQRTERYRAESAVSSLQLVLFWPLYLPRLLQSCFSVSSLLLCCCCILKRNMCNIVSCTQSAS